MFKDEAPYFKEWIEYHKLMGVEHFYLLNNDSTDNYLKVLKPYIKKGEVTVVDWSGGKGEWVDRVQMPGLLSGIEHFVGISKWVALIDIDEFIVPVEKSNLISFLEDYEDYAAVIINWQVYGTSGVKDVPKHKLMVETLTYRAPVNYEWNMWPKSIVRPERIDTKKYQYLRPHVWEALPGYTMVTPNKQEFILGQTFEVDKIRINHYWLRTDNYLYNEKIPKKERMQREVYREEAEAWRNASNQIKDKIIFKYVPALRKKVFGHKKTTVHRCLDNPVL